jgi:hypothetical protein
VVRIRYNKPRSVWFIINTGMRFPLGRDLDPKEPSPSEKPINHSRNGRSIEVL